MMRSFYNGISGVKTHSYGMDLLANNISNVNTVGYKAAVPEFKDIFYQTGLDVGGMKIGQNQIGLAASGLSSAFSQKQGALVHTERTFDIALEGKGFYGLKDLDGSVYYTRNGSFGIDKDFNLTDSFGRFVLGTMNAGFTNSKMSPNIQEMFGKNVSNDGYVINNENNQINLNKPNKQEPIKLPNTLFLNAKETTNISIKANISNEFKEGTKMSDVDGVLLSKDNETSTFKASNLKPNSRFFLQVDRGNGIETIEVFSDEFGSFNKQIRGNVKEFSTKLVEKTKEAVDNNFKVATYDEFGNLQYVKINIKAINDVNFIARATLEDGDGNLISENRGLISFNADGSLKENNLTEIGNIKLNLGNPKVNNTGGYDGLTCINNAKIERVTYIDGYPAGVLKDYDVDLNGNILANFTNGKSQVIAKLAVFNFVNEQGLSKNGENTFSATPDSGNPIFFYNENGEIISSYKIKSRYLEQSNVDLGVELTQVIAFQKAYEANAKSITTADQMLKRAIEMKK